MIWHLFRMISRHSRCGVSQCSVGYSRMSKKLSPSFIQERGLVGIFSLGA